MGENLFLSKIFLSKTACLFHDPPNKAWLLKSHKDHKEEARRIAISVLENTCLKDATERMEEIAKPADMLASSVDRWLLSKLVGEEYHLFPVSEIKLKNIFNPKFSQKVNGEQPSTDKFIKDLKGLIEPITDIRLAYHILYASYEPVWIQQKLPAGPADTRAPSHSVFDHNYATASIMNWLLEKKEPKGILLYIDLGGPQRFISSSRKLSDLWLSSYLASALAWSVFWIFVKALGPDVMVLPTCRGNPFYYHSLISELTRNGVNENVIEKIKKISGEFAGYDPDKDKIPRYAVVPVTATFMLPELEQLKELDDFKEIEVIKGAEGLEEFVKNKYREVWKSVYDKVIEKCKDLKSELDNMAIKAEELLNECKEFGFETTPPLPIRVIALHTNRLHELGLEEDERYSLYHYMFKLLGYEEDRRKLYKFRPEEDLKLFEMTSQSIRTWPKEASKGFEYCSVCGYLPAIIILPSDEDEYKKYLRMELEPIFGMGENLCPYCLIKRLMSMSKILKSVMDELLGETPQELPQFRFPSVSDIALMPFKKSFITNATKIDNNQELANELAKWIEEIWKEFAEKRISLMGREPIISIESKLAESIKKLKTDKLKGDLEEILFMDAEACFLRTYKFKKDEREEYYTPRRDWLKLRERIHKDERMAMYMNLKKEKIEDLNTYYAIIRCDGDNLGKIIQGKVEEGFRITIKDYLCNVLEGPAREVVEAIANNEYERAKKICKEHKVGEIDKKVNDISMLIYKLQDKQDIIISPSYHSTLSKALMANAIRDKEIIDKHDGLTIYAGGDDLLAVTPVKNSLSAVQKLREKFSFPSAEYKGFDIKDGYLIPSLATASRSFSIYLTHYMFPLYTAISRSAELLDSIAKESRWIIDAERREKDALILSYSPRGGERYSLLPLSDVKAPDQNLAKSLKYIDELVLQIEKERDGFSSSLIYDLYSNLQTIKPLIDKNSEALLKRLIERIFERNCEIQDKQLRKKKAEEWARKLIEDYDVSGRVDHGVLPFLEQFFLALMLYRSGLRGME
ncbi:MAG: type III-B CRISPR-associated protein Cas10/Cmr2 [Nitrososphaerales archaeon]